MKRISLFMCDVCFPDGIEIGEIAPGYVLILNESRYIILNGQGHRGDEIYVFDKKPEPHPDPSAKLKDDESVVALSRAWIDYICRIDLQFEPHVAYCFVKQCLKAGYVDGDSFIYWLFDRAGRLIRELEEGVKIVRTPKEAGSWDYRVMVRNVESHEESKCGASKCYGIHEVHYDEKSEPNAWSESQVSAASFEDLKWKLEKMTDALNDPILEDNATWPPTPCKTENPLQTTSSAV